MRTFSRIFCLFCLVLAPLIAHADASKIVAVLPLSGRLANIGRDLQNAITLQDTGAVSVVYEDDGFDPKNTVAAVQKSLTDPEVKGFIFFGSGTSLAAKPLIERSNIPAIAVAMSDKIVENSRYMFRYYVPAEAQAGRMAQEINHAGYKNVIFVVSQQEAMLGFQKYFQGNLAFPTGNYFEVQPGDTDLKSTALKISAMKPDAICLLLLPPELQSFAKQIRSIGYKGQFFGPTQIGNPDAAKAAEGALENTWFTGVDEASEKELISRFRNRFGTNPTSEALVAYDAAGLLAKAVTSKEPLQYFLKPTEFNGIFGANLAFVNPNTLQPPIALKRIKGVALKQEG